MSDDQEARRLEELWRGDFGDAYSERNAEASRGRSEFWRSLIDRLQPDGVLEVGCNVGGNLEWIAGTLDRGAVVGVDVNLGALAALSGRLPRVGVVATNARQLPFADGAFELVFTVGVLIHQPPSSLHSVMDEVVRCSRRWVLCAEYFAPDEVEVPYRDVERALWKRDYGREYLERHPSLVLEEQGFLAKGQGSWDDVTWWLFRT